MDDFRLRGKTVWVVSNPLIRISQWDAEVFRHPCKLEWILACTPHNYSHEVEAMAKATMIVFATAHPGKTEELDQWYDQRHIPDLLSVPGLVEAKRYDVRTLKMPEGCPKFDFLALYSMEGEDINTIVGAAAARMGTPDMPASPALDSSKTLALMAFEKSDK
ncbi:MAG: hypothetical protein ABW049_03275 [Spongiibacteraceae bacterium]